MSVGNFCTKLQDPTQLYLGAHDGSISIWAPPDNIRAHIKHVLKESAREYAKFRRNTPLNYTNEALNLEEAVEAHWFQTQKHSMRWGAWAKREALDEGLAQGNTSMTQSQSFSKANADHGASLSSQRVLSSNNEDDTDVVV